MAASLLHKGKTWYIRYKHNGKRYKKSSGTSSENEALALARQIDSLIIDEAANVDPLAKKIFFGEYPSIQISEGAAKELSKFKDPEKVPDSYIIGLQANEIATLKQELEKTKKERDEYKNKYKAITNTIEGKIVDLQGDIPTIEEALKRYLRSIQHLARYKRNYYNFIEALFLELGKDKKINEIRSIEIHDYLEKDGEGVKEPAARWMRQRQKFTKFFNWACGLWTFINPMDHVITKKVEEKEDVHFHDIKEVNKAIKKQDTIYNKALLSTLFFSGVSAHEFRGLRVEDYFELNNKWFLRVTPNECRNIKSKKRRRNIHIGKRLKKTLDEYLKSHNGTKALFPPTVCKEGREFWQEGTLSRFLNETVFLKDEDPRKEEEKHINKTNMNCLSTRRTFGSLSLRAGKNVAEVAAAMGNSIKMVELHYARIISTEVCNEFDEF